MNDLKNKNHELHEKSSNNEYSLENELENAKKIEK